MEAVNWENGFIYVVSSKSIPVFNVRVKHWLAFGEKVEEMLRGTFKWWKGFLQASSTMSRARAADKSGGYSFAAEVFKALVSASLPLSCLVGCTLQAWDSS